MKLEVQLYNSEHYFQYTAEKMTAQKLIKKVISEMQQNPKTYNLKPEHVKNLTPKDFTLFAHGYEFNLETELSTFFKEQLQKLNETARKSLMNAPRRMVLYNDKLEPINTEQPTPKCKP